MSGILSGCTNLPAGAINSCLTSLVVLLAALTGVLCRLSLPCGSPCAPVCAGLHMQLGSIAFTIRSQM